MGSRAAVTGAERVAGPAGAGARGAPSPGPSAGDPATAAAEPREHLPLRVVAGWGAGEWGGSLVWSMFYVFFLFFLTDVVGMGPSAAGLLLMIASLWMAVATPAVGVYSDTRRWRHGRRRPFLLLFTAPYAILSWLLFSDFGLSTTAAFFYFLGVSCLYALVFALVQVPYTALAAEITPDYNERTRLISYRTAVSELATMAGTVLPLLLVSWLAPALGSRELAWSVMAAVLAVTCVLPQLVAWRATRGYERRHEKSSSSLREIWRAARDNRSLLYALAAFTAFYAAVSVQSAVAVYFMTYRLGFGERMDSLVFLLGIGVTVAAIAPVSRIAQRFGKPRTLGVCMVAYAALACGFLLCGPGDAWLFLLLIALAAIPSAGGVLLTWAMIPDCTEVDEYKTGERREGLYYGLVTLAQQALVALLLWLVGSALSLSGYVADAVQTPSAMWTIRLLMSVGTAVCALAAAWAAFLQPMTPEKHGALTAAAEARRRGEEAGAEGFADLL